MGRKLSGCTREAINGQIRLRFGTLRAWMNPWGVFFFFFIFWIFLILDLGGPVLDPKWTGNLRGALGKGKWSKSLKRATFIAWVNAWECFFHFLKILIFGPWWTGPGSQMDRKLAGYSKEGMIGQILSEIWHI